MSNTGSERSKTGTPDQSRRSVLPERDASQLLQLTLLGDCMLGRLVNEVLEGAPPEIPWGDTLPILLSADWRMCNLECVISDRGKPWSAYPKAFHFRSAAKNIAALEAAQINAVSLANNHVLDYGYDAMFQMLEILDRAGIIHSGAGANVEEASRLAIASVRGKKLGLLAFTDNEPGWEAKADQPGVFYVPVDLKDWRAQNLLEIVRSQRNAVDLLIVSAHWGSNWGYLPEEGHVAFAHALVDAGAGVVFGHSCHVFRGIEIYKGRPIFYSAGNFVDDYAVDLVERNDESFIYVIDVQDQVSQGLRLYPTVIRRCQARRAEGVYEMAIAQKMQELCAPFGSTANWNQGGRCLEISCSTREDAGKAAGP
ncbi:MAG TPA: CapA family protein [Candidatus Acidoferrales bacterium]|nr:CapA family protein [Candidatus Acidoferrales bacterium]